MLKVTSPANDRMPVKTGVRLAFSSKSAMFWLKRAEVDMMVRKVFASSNTGSRDNKKLLSEGESGLSHRV